MPVRTVLCGFNEDDFPFINFIRNLGSFQSLDGYAYPTILGANGYPSAMPARTIAGRIEQFPPSSAYRGKYVLKWRGVGRLFLSPSVSVNQSPNLIIDSRKSTTSVVLQSGFTMDLQSRSDAGGRIVFQCSSDLLKLSIGSPGGTGTFRNFRDLALCRLDQEALHDSGEIFNPDFLAEVRAVNPGVLRMIGLGNPNENNIMAQHAYRAPSDYFPSGGWVSTAWVGNISGTDTYNCGSYADMPTEWTHGETFQGMVLKANTGVCTIDVGGRGAKPIGDVGLGDIGAGTMRANSLRTFVYDGYSDRVAEVEGGLRRQHSIEVQVALCNKLGIDLWYLLPHMMTDASVTALVSRVRDTLDPGLRFYFELSNEVWNLSAGFEQSFYFNYLGRNVYRFSNSSGRWYHGAFAKRLREIMYLVAQAWHPRSSSELRRVMAFQGAGDPLAITAYRLEGADLKGIGAGTYGCGAQSDFATAPDRPIDHVDVLSYGTYYSGLNAKNFDPRWTLAATQAVAAKADDYASGSPSLMAAALDWLDNDLRAAGDDQTLATVRRYHDNHNAVAARFRKPIVIYEGALEIKAPSTERLASLGFDQAYSAHIQIFFSAYKRDPRFYRLVRDQFDQFMIYSQAEAPAYFLLATGTQWSMIEGNLYGTPFQSYFAVRHFNNGVQLTK